MDAFGIKDARNYGTRCKYSIAWNKVQGASTAAASQAVVDIVIVT